MRLYVEGHSAKKGYAISRAWSDDECRQLPPATAEDCKPVRFVESRKKAFALAERWNRRFADSRRLLLVNLQGMTFTEKQARDYYGSRFETTELAWVTVDEDGQLA